jgi:hypothetical protein
MWTGLVLLRIGTSGELLWIRYWNFGLHKMLRNYRVFKQLGISRVVLSSMELARPPNKWLSYRIIRRIFVKKTAISTRLQVCLRTEHSAHFAWLQTSELVPRQQNQNGIARSSRIHTYLKCFPPPVTHVTGLDSRKTADINPLFQSQSHGRWHSEQSHVMFICILLNGPFWYWIKFRVNVVYLMIYIYPAIRFYIISHFR